MQISEYSILCSLLNQKSRTGHQVRKESPFREGQTVCLGRVSHLMGVLCSPDCILLEMLKEWEAG